MNYLERAIADDHAKLTGEGKQQAVPALNGGQRDFSLSASTGERARVRCRSLQHDERKKPYAVIECKADGVTDAEFNQAVEQACGNGTWAKFRANYVGVVAGMTRRFFDFSEKYGVLEREANIIADLPRQYGKPEEYRFYKGDPNNDIQPVSKEALITRSRNATRPFGRAASSRRQRRFYESDAMNSFPKNRNIDTLGDSFCATIPIEEETL